MQLGSLHRPLVEADRGSVQAGPLQAEVAHWVRAGDPTEEERLQTLTKPMRGPLDTVRMIADRAKTRPAAAIAPGVSRPETACTLNTALFRSDASLLPNPVAGTLIVRVLHQANRGQDVAVAPLLEELNQTHTPFPGTDLRLVYEIVSADYGAVDGPPPIRLQNHIGAKS